MLEYISSQKAAKKWGISERRVQKLNKENRIPSVAKFSRMWLQCGTPFIKDGKSYTLSTRDLCSQARKANINY